MSGGSLDYAFHKVEAVAETLEYWTCGDGSQGPPLPKLWLDFAAHLKLVATALRAAEWELSGDTGEGPADEAINKVLGDTAALTAALKFCIGVIRDEGTFHPHTDKWNQHTCYEDCKAYHDACALVGEEP